MPQTKECLSPPRVPPKFIIVSAPEDDNERPGVTTTLNIVKTVTGNLTWILQLAGLK